MPSFSPVSSAEKAGTFIFSLTPLRRSFSLSRPLLPGRFEDHCPAPPCSEEVRRVVSSEVILAHPFTGGAAEGPCSTEVAADVVWVVHSSQPQSPRSHLLFHEEEPQGCDQYLSVHLAGSCQLSHLELCQALLLSQLSEK